MHGHRNLKHVIIIYTFTIKIIKLQLQDVSVLFWSSSGSTHYLYVKIN
jgi:hypothetical protein